MNNSQKGAIQLVVLAVLILGAVSGIYLVQQRTNLLPKAFSPRNLWTFPSSSPSQINNDQDLKRVLMELESTDVDLIDMDITGWSKSDKTASPVPRASAIASPQATPKPNASCLPRPDCLDATPSCLLPVPAEGWCPSPSPTCLIPEGCSSPSPTSSQSENSSILDF